MIGDDDRDSFGAGRMLEALQDPAPWHPASGNQPAPKPLQIRLPAVVKKLQAPVDFVCQGRAFQTKLVRQPQQIDVAFGIAQDRFAFPVRPALGFQLGEAPVDAVANFKNRNAFGLGRVHGQRRADGNGRCVGLKGPGIDIGTGSGLGETVRNRGRAGIGFCLPSIKDGDGLVIDAL